MAFVWLTKLGKKCVFEKKAFLEIVSDYFASKYKIWVTNFVYWVVFVGFAILFDKRLGTV